MAASAPITIRRQIVDVDVYGTDTDGLALQQRLPALCTDVVSPSLEAAFARVGVGDEFVSIERLTIELCDVALDRLDVELGEAIRRQVDQFFRLAPPGHAGPAVDLADEVVERRTPAGAVDDALAVFLRSGRLPWWFRVPPGVQLEQMVVDAWTVDASTAESGGASSVGPLPATLSAALAEPAARVRLVKQFSPRFVVAVLRRWAPLLAASVDEVATRAAGIDSATLADIERGAHEAALVAAAERRHLTAVQIAEHVWAASERGGTTQRAVAATIERAWPDAAGSSVATTDRPPVRSDRSVPATPVLDADLDDERTGVAVDSAGVVLLHPFLSRFFGGLGLVDGAALSDRGRAVCLLHHLTTGETTAPEHALVVAKVLCGAPLDEPVEADVGLTVAETDEASALLEAAIGHWDALRNTSADALRSEFLMRPGVLSVDADGDWLLRVERRTVDVLLERLPWGVSTIALPWMRRLLRVEWT